MAIVPAVNPLAAHALRRSGVVSAALTATLAGHLATAPDARLLPVAPAVWLGVIALAVTCSAFLPRPERFREWGAPRTLLVLLCVQLGLHLAMHTAPWLFGFAGHAHASMFAAGAVAMHLVIAAVMLLPLRAGQRLLGRLVEVARTLLAPRRRRPSWPAARRLAVPATEVRSRSGRAPRTSRGPPPVRPAPVGPLLTPTLA